jgi:hypothetical protein
MCRYPRHKNRGVMEKYNRYALLMGSRLEVCGSERHVIICNGLCLFAGDSLSDTKPIPIKDWEEHALGVALVFYLIGVGIKNQGTGRSRSDQRAHSDAQYEHERILSSHVRVAEHGREEEGISLAHVPQGEAGHVHQSMNVRQWTRTAQQLKEEGHHVVNHFT